MRPRIRLLVYLALYWVFFLVTSRILFLVYNYDYSSQLTFIEITKAMLHGLKMDLSITGYMLMFSALVLSISTLSAHNRWAYYVIHSFSLLTLFLSSIIIIVDLELYRHWGFRLNTTPLLYLGPEAAGSVQVSVVITLMSLLIFLLAGFSYLYYATIIRHAPRLPKKNFPAFTGMLCISGLMFLPIRGSFTVAPMNTGFVYFHKTKMFANHSAVNVVWNFLYSLRKSAHVVYPEDFYNSDKTKQSFSDLYPPSDTTYSVLTTNKPNIILLILESFTAGVVQPLGGKEDICPNLSNLCREGILFDNFFASGDRTDKGLISILSGYPAQPQTSIIKYPAKTQHLPYLPKTVQKLGYRTSFLYGGDVDFANFRSYLTSCGFDHITSLDDFPDELDAGKWGVHDEHVFRRSLSLLDTCQSPFMQVILTQSSHEPFTVPMDPFIKGNDEESLFLNSCHYTDKCIGQYIEQAKKQSWWQNTLLIITADHGHRHPGNKRIQDKERFRIPFLMLGGAVATTDSVIHTLGSQTDIANTILAQLDKPLSEFKFSKNMLGNPVKPFAIYFFNDGYGFLTPDTYLVHDNPGRQFIIKEGDPENEEVSKAYQQMLYSDYNLR